MRYYVIINGINSLTIPGLAIKDLPPISKTLMRNQKETIDGRDGDIITELGYSAYDKALTIGLYGSYDINDIIAFFNQKGTIVFSDEPDKYYNFTILDQIDYDKLVKFRTATIRIHCQPFKYPVSETPVEIEAEYVTAQGEELTLNDTGVAPLEIGLKGNTYQETTTGKNLIRFPYDATSGTYGNVAVTMNNDGSVTFNGTGNETAYINIISTANKIHLGAGTYTLSTKNAGIEFTIRDTAGSLGYIDRNHTSATFTISEAKDVYLFFAVRNGTSYNVTIYPMLETGSSVTEWEKPTNGASPNPSYPQEVQVVTGDNTINIVGKNLFSGSIIGIKLYSSNGAQYNDSGGATSDFIPVNFITNPNYYISGVPTDLWNFVAAYNSNKEFLGRTGVGADGLRLLTSSVFAGGTPQGTGDIAYLRLTIYENVNVPGTIDEVENANIMLNIGNTALPYTPHQRQEYEINLGSLELCKIGIYQDYLYKSGENWYKHKEIAKTKLLSTWSWFRDNEKTNSWRFYSQSNAIPNSHNSEAVSNYFKGDTVANVNNIDSQAITTINYIQIALRINKSIAPTVDDLKTWLSNNEVYDYTILSTPTEEQITNAELIEQLEAILNAVSYEDQTNISQENDNMPFILDVSALQKSTNEAIIDNEGNIYSKPIINIVGDGIVGVSLNGSQILSLDMTTYNDITIDTETMEAYDSNGLRNRQVTGNYNNLRLQPGENTISLNGRITSATISKYKRWL